MNSLPTPPPEIVPYLEVLTPEGREAVADKLPDDPAEAWSAIAVNLGLEDAVAKVDLPYYEPRALAVALLALPTDECHDLSRRYPLEVLSIAGFAWQYLADEDLDRWREIGKVFVAPEILAAFEWRCEFTPKLMAETFGQPLTAH